MTTTNHQIDDEVAAAMRFARGRSGLAPEQFARELNRLVPEYHLDVADIAAIENSKAYVLARHLVAAARIAGQPVSACLGEMELYEATIPALERRLLVVEERLEALLPGT